MLVSVGMKAPVLVTVIIHHHTKLIQVLRSAGSAHPGHAASDAFAQTFLVQNWYRVSIVNAFDSEDGQ